MYNSEFNEYLSGNTGVDFKTIEELFDKMSNVFDVASTLINLYGIDKVKLGKMWGDYLGFAYVDPNESIVNAEYVKKMGIDFIKKIKLCRCIN